jgi:HAMP domain-containing protein
MLTSSVALLLACAAFTSYEWVAFRRGIAAHVTGVAQVVGANSSAALAFRDRSSAQEILSGLRTESHLMRACLYEPDGEVLASYTRPNAGADVCPSLDPGRTEGFEEDSFYVWKLVRQNEQVMGALYLQSDLAEMNVRLAQYGWIAAGVLAVSLISAFLLASRLQSVISMPLIFLAGIAKKVSTDKDYSIRAEARSNDEIGVLIQGFNEMLSQIEERDAELREHQEHLEQKVAARTVELVAANAQLTEARRAPKLQVAQRANSWPI